MTDEQARAVDAVLARPAKTGSPALRSAIESERRTHPPGPGFAHAVLRAIQR